MRAIQITHTGGPEVLTLAELPVPFPGPGQVLVKIAAVGVNFIEIYFRAGWYKSPWPFIFGSEFAGSGESGGPVVDGCAPGDPVATTAALVSYA